MCRPIVHVYCLLITDWWRSTRAALISWVYILRTQQIRTGNAVSGRMKHSNTWLHREAAQARKSTPFRRHRLFMWHEQSDIGRRALYSIIAQECLHGQSIVNWQPRCLREGLEWRLGAVPGLSSYLAAFCWETAPLSHVLRIALLSFAEADVLLLLRTMWALGNVTLLLVWHTNM